MRSILLIPRVPSSIFYQSKQVREKTEKYLEKYSEKNIDKNLQSEINADCRELNRYVKVEKTLKLSFLLI